MNRAFPFGYVAIALATIVAIPTAALLKGRYSKDQLVVGAPIVPPNREFKWDIGPKDSRIEQEFVAGENRAYIFAIAFGGKNDPRGEDQSWRNDERVRDFIGRSGEPGVIIPVHIQVEKLDPAGNRVMMDRTVNTRSMSSGGQVITRRIDAVSLTPGQYRVTVNTLQETIVPEGPGTYLQITFFWNQRVK